MKAKIGRGNGFRGLLNYVFGEDKHGRLSDKQAESVGGNMVGMCAADLSKEFAVVRKLRPDIKNPVWHCSLSLPKGEKLSAEEWDAVSQDFMKSMGFDTDRYQYTVVRHSDTDHDHAHIVASRISLDGEIWHGRNDVYKAIDATHELEKKHGLVLTATFEEKADKKKLTAKEINMGVRTGVEPPRQKLQRLIDEAVMGNPNAVDFCERMKLSGVSVNPAVASKTGLWQGMSYEIDGIAFKASGLGKAYSPAGLLKRGVTYDETTDRAGLERLRTEFANRESSNEPAAASSAAEPVHDGNNQATRDHPGDVGRGGWQELETARDVAAISEQGFGSLRSSERGPARDFGGVDAGNSDQVAAGHGEDRGGQRENIVGVGSRGVTAESVDSRRDSYGEGIEDTTRVGGHLSDRNGERSRATAQSGKADEQRSSEGQSAMVENGPNPSDCVADVGNKRRGSGLDRFKRAAIDKRNAATGADKAEPGVRSRVSSSQRGADEGAFRAGIRDSKAVDPTAFLENHGYSVKWQGKHASVKAGADEVYRVTKRDDSKYLWTDLYGNAGGDNIDLVREVKGENVKLHDAIWELTGSPSVKPKLKPAEPKREPPKVIPFDRQQQDAGRQYLQGRWIDKTVLDKAENEGFLSYDKGGVLFVGRDAQGKERSVTRRAVDPADTIQKRDYRGTEKKYPPILRGNDKSIWIVEGGADALAVQSYAKLRNMEPPTVIVSGGVGVRSYLDNEHVRELLKGAERVTIPREREKDTETQAKTEAQLNKLVDAVEEQTRIKPAVIDPPGQAKDMAAALDTEVRTIQQRELEMQRQQLEFSRQVQEKARELVSLTRERDEQHKTAWVRKMGTPALDRQIKELSKELEKSAGVSPAAAEAVNKAKLQAELATRQAEKEAAREAERLLQRDSGYNGPSM